MTCQYCAIPIGAHTFKPGRIICFVCGYKMFLGNLKTNHIGLNHEHRHVFEFITPKDCPRCSSSMINLLADCEDGIAAPGWPVREEAEK